MLKNRLLYLQKANGKRVPANDVSQADIKRTAKQLGMTEFFKAQSGKADSFDGPPTLQSAIHANFYISSLTLTYYYINKKNKTSNDYPATLRMMMDNIRTLRYYLPSVLLPHIKGLRKTMIDFNHTPEPNSYA